MTAKPFLKWAGGKRALLPSILPLVPREIGVYLEPFLGGGALFFALPHRPKHALLSDANLRLVRTYRAVRDQVEDVIERLETMPNTAEEFERIRNINPDKLDDAGAAAWMIYLNKTCFNGLYRVNKAGKFNVPFGRYKNPKILDAENLLECSRALAGVEIVRCDFKVALVPHWWRGRCFAYCDPPYIPTSETANFTSYTADGFGPTQHAELRDAAVAFADLGGHALLCNSDTQEAWELYRPELGFSIREVRRSGQISCKGNRRGSVGELLISIGGKAG